MELARLFDASITLLHMTGPMVWSRKIHADAGNHLARARHAIASAGIPVNTRVVESRPVPEILYAATAFPASVIAMATHGRSGVSRLWNRSVTEEVLRRTERPMLLVRFRRAG
jgi:nucleotide-binding universal stress UspA family protein